MSSGHYDHPSSMLSTVNTGSPIQPTATTIVQSTLAHPYNQQHPLLSTVNTDSPIQTTSTTIVHSQQWVTHTTNINQYHYCPQSTLAHPCKHQPLLTTVNTHPCKHQSLLSAVNTHSPMQTPVTIVQSTLAHLCKQQ